MSRCSLVGAGDFTSFSPSLGDLVIAADGGYDMAVSCSAPTVLVGDFDSICGTLPDGIETHRHPVKKDETDMMLAYRIGVEKGYTDFVIVGGTGGRPDHTFANYSLLLHIVSQSHTAKMIDDKYEYTVIKNSGILLPAGDGGDRVVSIFAIGGTAHGVDIRGLEYELSEGVLTPEFALGVSNKLLCRDAEISVRDGALLIMLER